MIFFFSGRNRPSKEFNFILDQIGYPYVQFYDTSNRWYMESFWNSKIQRALDMYGSPVLSLGCSMGGWGALYHQPQIQANKILAFAPQGTTISREIRNIGGKNSDCWADDLEPIIGSRLPTPDGRAVIYFGNHPDDGIGNSGHAKLILDAGYKITTVEVSDPTEHEIARMLYHKNQLVDIIKNVIC